MQCQSKQDIKHLNCSFEACILQESNFSAHCHFVNVRVNSLICIRLNIQLIKTQFKQLQ